MPDRAESAFRRSLHAAEGEPLFAAWASARLGACLAREGRPQDAVVHVHAAMRQGLDRGALVEACRVGDRQPLGRG